MCILCIYYISCITCGVFIMSSKLLVCAIYLFNIDETIPHPTSCMRVGVREPFRRGCESEGITISIE